MANYATHKAAVVRDWLARRPQWHIHLTPTSASWLNQIERFLGLLTDKQIKRCVHRSVTELRKAIKSFLDQHNSEPKPFDWTKSADDILASIERFCTYNQPPNTMRLTPTNFCFITLAQHKCKACSAASRARPAGRREPAHHAYSPT